MDTEIVNSLPQTTLVKKTTSPSANRMRYKAEVSLIQSKIGDLERIRANLGLSRRKICQLLLVDPSAWTRWTAPKSDAPPHIYRALEWYLLLTEKEPRALLPLGSWSTTAFEDRFQQLESNLKKLDHTRRLVFALLVIFGMLLGAGLTVLIRH